MLKKTLNKLNIIIAMYLWFPLQAFAEERDVAEADVNELNEGLKKFIDEYNIIVAGVLGFGLLTGLLAMIYLIMKLSAVGDQPQARAEVLKEMMMVGITTALIGAFSFILGTYYSIIING